MRMRSFLYGFLSLLLVVLCINASAQQYEKGIKYLQMDQPETAAEIFFSLLTANPDDAKGIFGLGEYYFKTRSYDSSLVLFQKYVALNPEDPYGYVAIGKTYLNLKNSVEADIQFTMAAKMEKKNYQLLGTIANANIEGEIKDLVKAKEYLSKANEINTRCAGNYLIDSKIDLYNKDHNSALGKLMQALCFDSTLCEAYLLLSNIYTDVGNYKLALKYISTAQRIDPDYLPAYKKIGEIYYKTAKYKEAAEAYLNYMQNADYDKNVHEKYAFCQFFDKNYTVALSEIHKLVADDTTNHVLIRLMAYINCEKGEYAKGLELMNKFFASTKPEKYISLDFEYNGKLLAQSNNDSLAIISYLQAYALDSLKVTLLSDIARSYGKIKDYEKSSRYYKNYISQIEVPLPSDYFLYGKALYSAGNFEPTTTADSLKKTNYLIRSDSIFQKIMIISPSSHLGYFWDARVKSLLDPESTKGLAKPYYEKAIELMSANPEKYKRELTEAYSYLGYYYFLNEDKEQSGQWWEKILAIDPNNEKATEALNGLKELK